MIGDIFEVRVPIAELVLRGTLVFWTLFLIFRFLMRRDTIVGSNWLLDWPSFRFPAVRKFSQAKRLTLIRKGIAQRRNLRGEYITMDELGAKLREHRIEKMQDARAAYLEGDGGISVILADDPHLAPEPSKRKFPA